MLIQKVCRDVPVTDNCVLTQPGPKNIPAMQPELSVDLQFRNKLVTSHKMVITLLLLFIPTIAGLRENPFKGFHIKVTGYDASPGLRVIKDPVGNVTFVGYTKDIMDGLFEQLEMTYTFVYVNETEVATKGITQAVLNQIIRKEVDFNAYGFVRTYERSQIMDFTIPAQIEQYRFLVRYPDEESRLWWPIRPFQTPVWIAFAISCIIIAASLTLLMIYSKDPSVRQPLTFSSLAEKFTENATYVLTIITNQGDFFHSKRVFLRILVGTWCLMALVLVNSYTGNFISYVTVPKLNPIVNSFEELAASRHFRLAIEDRSVLSQRILVKNELHPDFNNVICYFRGIQIEIIMKTFGVTKTFVN